MSSGQAPVLRALLAAVGEVEALVECCERDEAGQLGRDGLRLLMEGLRGREMRDSELDKALRRMGTEGQVSFVQVYNWWRMDASMENGGS